MKMISTIVLVILIFLAVSSGVTKVLLMQQDVEFFGEYGFSSSFLVVFGLTQVLGGVLLAVRKARFAGATIVAITFLISLALLLMDGNIPVSVATIVAIALLAFVMKRS